MRSQLSLFVPHRRARSYSPQDLRQTKLLTQTLFERHDLCKISTSKISIIYLMKSQDPKRCRLACAICLYVSCPTTSYSQDLNSSSTHANPPPTKNPNNHSIRAPLDPSQAHTIVAKPIRSPRSTECRAASYTRSAPPVRSIRAHFKSFTPPHKIFQISQLKN